jgi:hypothetical protein
VPPSFRSARSLISAPVAPAILSPVPYGPRLRQERGAAFLSSLLVKCKASCIEAEYGSHPASLRAVFPFSGWLGGMYSWRWSVARKKALLILIMNLVRSIGRAPE